MEGEAVVQDPLEVCITYQLKKGCIQLFIYSDAMQIDNLGEGFLYFFAQALRHQLVLVLSNV